jgi:hypothetical protein
MLYKTMTAVLMAGALVTSVQAAPKQKKDDTSETVTCTVERSVGSHIPQRVCMTRTQRDEQAKANQEASRRLHDRPRAMSSGGS